ncbi:pilus assembly protein [Microbacterium sp. LRZ72]|uniref:TadE family protein n=1 Tax=Microbacterium sp. LRZ72 TaxID=2942481 RepID=UPI0029AB582D|nr:TadE/TadG family type IV pilus assembly protein [Microbacterium sp. LRZ72]MDX2377906.1 pilus assembly protein [Microbacterium sp. LRZ72]
MTTRSRSTTARVLGDDEGSAAVEFVLVGTVLTFLMLAVIQLGIAVYVRNVVHDAAVAGAHAAALVGATDDAAAARVGEITGRTLGPRIDDVSVRRSTELGYPAVHVRVTAALPVLGLWGPAAGLEVDAHAPVESLL